MWFEFALLAAATNAANQIITKRLSKSFNAIEISTFGQLIFAVLIFPFYFLSDIIIIPVNIQFHFNAWITISLNIAAILLLVDAISKSDLSYALPFLAVSSVFTIVSAWLIRGESVSFMGIGGIIAVVIGAFGIDVKSFHDWITLGGRRILYDKGVLRVLTVAFLYSIASVYDKTATLLSSPFTFVWYSALCRAIILLGIFIIWRNKRFHALKLPDETAVSDLRLPQNLMNFLLLSLFVLVGATFVIEAVSQTSALQSGLVAFVFAVKRLSILLTSAAGIIFFGERFTWFRLLGAAVMVSGTCCIYFS